MLSLVSHGENVEGKTNRRTDGWTLDRYITLSAINAASVIIITIKLKLNFLRSKYTDTV